MASIEKCLPEEAASLLALDMRHLDILAAVASEEPKPKPLSEKHEVILGASGIKFTLEDAKTLIDLGLVSTRIVDRVLRCPRCDYLHLSPKLLCPYCGSTNIEKVRIIQHVICGYIDLEFMFRQDGRMVCPNCSLEITSENDYRVLGTLFYCHNCKMRFHEPDIILVCERCGHRFKPADGSYKPVTTLTLTRQGKSAVEKALDIRVALYKTLSESNVGFECNASLIGATGVPYTVDYYIPGKKVAIDVVPSLTSHSDALLLLVKTRDLTAAGRVEKHIIVSRRVSRESIASIEKVSNAILVNETLPSRAAKRVHEIIHGRA